MNRVATNMHQPGGVINQKYTGAELAPGIAFRTFRDSTAVYNIIVTRGEANVSLDHMVDIEDVMDSEPIYSEDMLNFIIEVIGCTDLEKLVFIQRYFVRLIGEIVESYNSTTYYKGDDIMVEGKKLSVSIATVSNASGLIHIGLNASGDKYPEGVNAIALSDFIPDHIGLDYFIEAVIESMASEINDIFIATTKVISR